MYIPFDQNQSCGQAMMPSCPDGRRHDLIFTPAIHFRNDDNYRPASLDCDLLSIKHRSQSRPAANRLGWKDGNVYSYYESDQADPHQQAHYHG